MFIAKKFDILKNFDIFITIVFMDAGIFFRHQAELILRHQMRVSNYFVNSFYSVGSGQLSRRSTLLSRLPMSVAGIMAAPHVIAPLVHVV